MPISALTSPLLFFSIFSEKDERRLLFSQRNSAIEWPPFFQHERIPCTSDLMPLSRFLNSGLPRLHKDGGPRFYCPRTPFIRAECTGASCRDSDLIGRSQFCPTYQSFSNRKVLPFSHTDALTFRYVLYCLFLLFTGTLAITGVSDNMSENLIHIKASVKLLLLNITIR